MISRAQLAALLICLTLCGCQARAESAQTGYSATALYNLGNSYARAGKPGMAVLNYERASLLAPNDSDIEANLRYIRDELRLPSESRNWFDRAVRVASPAVFSWIGVVGLLIVGLSLLAGRLDPGHRSMRRVATIVGSALVGLTACNGVALWPTLHEAVVITSATPVLVSPVPMGDPQFVLPEAETVRMTAEHEGFVLVQTRAGRTGWISRANLAPVVPGIALSKLTLN
jgi:tetratricopeptide (TPR) repeat protein